MLSITALQKRAQLPLKPDSVVLEGRYVTLRPLVIERDVKALFEVSDGSPVILGDRSIGAYDPEDVIWRYLFEGPFDNELDFRNTLESILQAQDRLVFCVFDRKTDRQVGMASYLNNSPAHLKIELGGIWYSPIVQGTLANTEASFLMMQHAFQLGYRRVEWKCDNLNERSKKSALRMGFQFEGIQESHFIVKDKNRDTAWFRVLQAEWPEVKKGLEAMLYAASVR